MTDTIANKVERFSVDVPDQAGEGARLLGVLSAAKVNLIAAWGYPLASPGAARIELVPADSAALRDALKKAKIKAKRECAGFHITGKNKTGALSAALATLAEKGVNIHSVQAASSGGKFGGVITVEGKDVRKAAKALGV